LETPFGAEANFFVLSLQPSTLKVGGRAKKIYDWHVLELPRLELGSSNKGQSKFSYT